MASNGSARRCVHIVLVPGFAGFDALGQLEYYAGVTPQFQRWRKLQGNRDADVDLHYFDNFPTAGVRTRADRLRRYLAKRVARGEFVKDDWIALIGHSTGGLDIRWLLWKLFESPNEVFPVDGAIDPDFMVSARDILSLIKRVIFLSVPQWGTNIADWVRSYKLGRKVTVGNLRWGFTGTQLPIVDVIDKWVWNFISDTAHLGIADAVRDTISECEAGDSRNPTVIAAAQEAASETQLWLRYMDTDFHAIDDLAVDGDDDSPQTPARFDAAMRAQEVRNWKDEKIVTRSYATFGPRPFKFTAGKPVRPWDLLNPLSNAEVMLREPSSPATHLTYRAVYRACAGGPFAYHNGRPPVGRWLFSASKHPPKIELWDNDGIVNTASMFWPNGKDTLLVECDHLDIVGHYANVLTACKCSRRKYQSYDLLGSGSKFNEPAFAKVWNDIFDCCVRPESVGLRH